MKRKQFSVEQIVAVLKQAELGMSVADIIRQVGISEQTFYRWKQYAGLQSDQMREFKQLQDENARHVVAFLTRFVFRSGPRVPDVTTNRSGTNHRPAIHLEPRTRRAGQNVRNRPRRNTKLRGNHEVVRERSESNSQTGYRLYGAAPYACGFGQRPPPVR
jgi:putative transposase